MKRIQTTITLLFFLSLPLFAQESLSFLYQNALFTEETEGDIDSAIVQYQEILKRGTTSEELTGEEEQILSKAKYQLGLCYYKLDQTDMAVEQWKKVVSTYNCHEEVVNKARNYLLKLNPEFSDQNRSVAMIAAPWGMREMTRYKEYSENGGEVGSAIYTIQNSSEKGVKTYVITIDNINPNSLWQHRSGAVVRAEDMAPLRSFADYGKEYSWSADYSGTTVTYRSKEGRKETENQTTVTLPVFDNEEVYYLLRRMPLKVGYSDSTMVFNNTNGMSVKGMVEVKGIETVTTELGSFSCFKLYITSSLQGDQNYEETVWFTADEKKIMVQSVNYRKTLKLVQIDTSSSFTSEKIEDEKLSVTATLPKNVHVYRSRMSNNYESVYQLYSPDVRMQALFITFHDKPDGKNIEFVDVDIRNAKRWWNKYKVEKNSVVNKTINGIPVIQHVAETKYRDNAPNNTIEYRTYYFTESQIHCLIFRTTSESFGKEKPLYDSIAEAVTLK